MQPAPRSLATASRVATRAGSGLSSVLPTKSTGLAVRKKSSLTDSGGRPIWRTVWPASRPVFTCRSTASRALASFSPQRALGSVFSSCLSTLARSARMSSVSMISTSRLGSTPPMVCTTSGSLKSRTSIMTASTSRMCERNLLPRPSPCAAPLTRPAMSTKRTVAGTLCLGLKSAVQALQPRVGHGHDAHVGLDGGEGIVGGGRVARGQGVEDGGFSDVGQADDADLHPINLTKVATTAGFFYTVFYETSLPRRRFVVAFGPDRLCHGVARHGRARHGHGRSRRGRLRRRGRRVLEPGFLGPAGEPLRVADTRGRPRGDHGDGPAGRQ